MKNDPKGEGFVSSVEQRDARKEEIKNLIQHYWLGYRFETPKEDVCGKEMIEYDEKNGTNTKENISQRKCPRHYKVIEITNRNRVDATRTVVTGHSGYGNRSSICWQRQSDTV